MAYLVLIGSLPWNKTGVGSRGYHVFRRDMCVYAFWGPVHTQRKRSVRILWSRRPLYQEYACRSVKLAIRKLKRIIDEQEKQGYDCLGAGARIYRTARTASSSFCQQTHRQNRCR